MTIHVPPITDEMIRVEGLEMWIAHVHRFDGEIIHSTLPWLRRETARSRALEWYFRTERETAGLDE